MRCSFGFNGVRIRFEVANPVLVSLLALVLLFVVGEEQLGLISEIGLTLAAKLHFQKRQALLDRVQARYLAAGEAVCDGDQNRIMQIDVLVTGGASKSFLQLFGQLNLQRWHAGGVVRY